MGDINTVRMCYASAIEGYGNATDADNAAEWCKKTTGFPVFHVVAFTDPRLLIKRYSIENELPKSCDGYQDSFWKLDGATQCAKTLTAINHLDKKFTIHTRKIWGLFNIFDVIEKK